MKKRAPESEGKMSNTQKPASADPVVKQGIEFVNGWLEDAMALQDKGARLLKLDSVVRNTKGLQADVSRLRNASAKAAKTRGWMLMGAAAVVGFMLGSGLGVGIAAALLLETSGVGLIGMAGAAVAATFAADRAGTLERKERDAFDDRYRPLVAAIARVSVRASGEMKELKKGGLTAFVDSPLLQKVFDRFEDLRTVFQDEAIRKSKPEPEPNYTYRPKAAVPENA